VVKAPARRELVHHLAGRGLSERHALRVVGMRPVPTDTSLRRIAIQPCAKRSWLWRTGTAAMAPA
jgi:hypothetical protein